MKLKLILFILLILLPLTLRLGTRWLVYEGDHDPARRAQVLEFFNEEDITAGREYYRAYQAGGAVSSLLYYALLAVLLFSGVTRRLADWAARVTGGRVILEVLLVGLTLFLLFRLVLLPISYYHGFVLEGRFGFRRLELAGWILRVLKGWGVTAVTQAIVAIPFFWFARRVGRRWLWPVAGAMGAISYVAIVLWPLVVLPLFYSITPVPDGELRDGIVALAERAGVTVDKVHMIDQSRVSSHTNAFFVGIGPRRSIYLYDTLTEDHDVPEILSVVGHEMGHWIHRHVLKGWAMGCLAAIVGLLLFRRLLDSAAVRRALGVRDVGDVALIPVIWALLGAVGLYTAPIENGISRALESQADQYTLDLLAEPDTFIAMKVNSARANRRDLLPHPMVTFWYASHPPVIQRLLAAEAWKAAHAPPPP